MSLLVTLDLSLDKSSIYVNPTFSNFSHYLHSSSCLSIKNDIVAAPVPPHVDEDLTQLSPELTEKKPEAIQVKSQEII